jgi:hypothetical protein
LPGEYLSGNYRLATPAGLPAGNYQMEAGMCRPDTDERLLVTGKGASAQGTSIQIGRAEVSE